MHLHQSKDPRSLVPLFIFLNKCFFLCCNVCWSLSHCVQTVAFLIGRYIQKLQHHHSPNSLQKSWATKRKLSIKDFYVYPLLALNPCYKCSIMASLPVNSPKGLVPVSSLQLARPQLAGTHVNVVYDYYICFHISILRYCIKAAHCQFPPNGGNILAWHQVWADQGPRHRLIPHKTIQ